MFFLDFVWSLSNDIILSVSLDGTAKLWDVAAGSCIRTIEDEQGGELLCCAFQPLNNNMFVVSFLYGYFFFTIRIFIVLDGFISSKETNLSYSYIPEHDIEFEN